MKLPSQREPSRTRAPYCKNHLPDNHRIEIVDLLQDPRRVLSDKIVATPTLIKVSPAPVQKIIGDLSEEAKVLFALGLQQGTTSDKAMNPGAKILVTAGDRIVLARIEGKGSFENSTALRDFSKEMIHRAPANSFDLCNCPAMDSTFMVRSLQSRLALRAGRRRFVCRQSQ